MTITTILFDCGGVLYHRPREDRHLAAFLEERGLALRHRSVVDRALRAARFDVQSGRISRDAFYDAILRMHGLDDENLFAEGRAALLKDAADIELFPGVPETLAALRAGGLRLATVSDSAHLAHEKVAWLAARGLVPDLWDAFVVSSGVGMLKSGGALFERALVLLELPASEAAFVGHDSDELTHAAALRLTTIAFMPDDPTIQTNHTITSFYGLQDLFLGSEAGS